MSMKPDQLLESLSAVVNQAAQSPRGTATGIIGGIAGGAAIVLALGLSTYQWVGESLSSTVSRDVTSQIHILQTEVTSQFDRMADSNERLGSQIENVESQLRDVYLKQGTQSDRIRLLEIGFAKLSK